MQAKFDKYIALLAALGIIFANTVAGFADFEDDGMQSFVLEAEQESEQVVEQVVDQTEDFEDPAKEEALEKQELFMKRLKDEFNLSKTDYQQILTQVTDVQEHLHEISEHKTTLTEQLNNLDAQITMTTDRLMTVVKQVVETENEITSLYEEIEIREVALNYQKELLKDYIEVIYKEQNEYFNIDESGKVDAFKLLLADGSVGNNLKELEFFDLLNEAGIQMVETLDTLAKELKDYQASLGQKREELLVLQDGVEEEKRQLEYQRDSKQNLLDLTAGQEQIYEQLLEQTIREQEQLLSDVKNLNNALSFMEAKMAEEGADFDPDKYLALLDYRSQALYEFQMTYIPNNAGFAWPVEPARGISAYFRDAGYVGVFGVQHNAVDIPEYQGSTVRAAADGVVYTAKDNGYGYSYIILAHANGFMTVYGHISSILVDEGQTVTQGAIIGLSGGMPGSKGAGYMTTGPHLHFEMLLNGLYVDPLEYLPLNVFTAEEIASMPEKYYDDWEGETLNLDGEALSR